jgi:signal transduction histidine kinase
MVHEPNGRPRYSIGIVEDITERKRSRDELEGLVQERTARLQQALAELEHFSYAIVHDMRAPLRAMESYAEMVERECVECSRPRPQEYLRRIKVASQRMDQLITDALSYSQAVRQELPLRPVALSKLLPELVETYPNLHPDKADIQIPEGLPTVLGNEAGLTQCFSNLLDNAVKFVAPGIRPRIRVWAEQGRIGGLMDKWRSGPGDSPDQRQSRERAAEPSDLAAGSGGSPQQSTNPTIQQSSPSVRIWVADNGIGIPKEAQEQMFAMFRRMHHEHEYPGTGIGLAVVRKVVERMGGRVGVESEPGQGSRFWIELSSEIASRRALD